MSVGDFFWSDEMEQPTPKPGDKVVIVTGRPSFLGKTFLIVECPPWSCNKDKIWVEIDDCHVDHIATLPPNYIILGPMSEQHAQPGDTIMITWGSVDWRGKKLKVIERQTDPPPVSEEKPGDAWFFGIKGLAKFFRKEDYVVIESCVPNDDRGSEEDVDVFLKKQRDANLKSVFS